MNCTMGEWQPPWDQLEWSVVGMAVVALSLPAGVVTVMSWLLEWRIENREGSVLSKWWNSG